MCKKVFLDANIIIDANDKDRPSHKESLNTLRYLAKNRVKIYTSCDLITTIYYILSKNSKQEALNSIEKLTKFCKIIDFSNKEVDSTCKLMREDKKFTDLEDTMQYVLALKEDCDLIISNGKNFKSDKIELLSSNEFCTQQGLLNGS
ncbi:MAG: ribonuclease [Epsilonproteobacteria bacterium]|nr:MAG: ribonuclease [Campylobacterota bacterium]